MIPSVLSTQVRKGVEDFLRTTFPISTPFFHGVVDRLIDSEGGLFKGPYISIKLPFRSGNCGPDFFPDIPMAFPPHQHQESAFVRLSGESPRSTLVATGTGSGKTECFLYPLLNHCLQERKQGKKGIKAIIVYPMNALATDQSKRIARTISQNPNLKNMVTAGLFIGQKEASPSQVMTDEWVITDRDTLRLTPPDILLTNYKMLDYLLIRPKDYPIWQENAADTLKYLVVDELHTFDGAQGTDLACLIRRIKARLKTPEKHLCCVGTSATLGGQEDTEKLRAYAAQVFGETFDPEAIITESLMTADEFLSDGFISRSGVVSPDYLERMRPENYADFSTYIKEQYQLWFDEPPAGTDEEWTTELGRKLKGHGFFWKLLLTMNNYIIPLDNLVGCFDRIVPEFSNRSDDYGKQVMTSMIALVSAARTVSGGSLRPFLNVRYQLWLRELRRIISSVGPDPSLKFSDDLKAEELQNHLPVIHCRECGATGWGGIKRIQDSKLNPDLQSFYQGFFRFSPTIVFAFPTDGRGTPGEQQELAVNLCGTCLHFVHGSDAVECPFCSSNVLVPIFLAEERIQRGATQYGSHDCPFCDGNNSLTILGSRAASLTSVVISQLYASTYNDDKKLLTFSDSVQDASHRAGFFAARTYRFNLRAAIQKVVEQSDKTFTLSELPDAFVNYWLKRKQKTDFIATFLPPDMEWFPDYEYMVKNGSIPHDADLEQKLRRRLDWEIISEYGFTCRIGRTLEKTGVSIASIRQDALDAAIEGCLETLRNEVGGLTQLTAEDLLRFFAGVLTQMKQKGAIFHPELEQYIDNWGSYYVLARPPHMPNYGKFSRTPAFLTTKSGNRFDTVLSRGTSRTWYQEWLEKSFGKLKPGISDYAEPIFKIVLDALVSAGVLHMKVNQGFPVWGLNPDNLSVEASVQHFRCSTCGHFVSASGHEAPLWEGNACLRFKCRGEYRTEIPTQDYYGTLYSKGHVERIFAHEHTGLLERDTREELERRFIKGGTAGSPNLLSCTPTLEMGIDIGDLSSVILCSVPPSQANYLQRIGRTGRRDGNSFNFTVAVGRPHDLFFYAEPEEMLAGRIEPPGCFLDAPAVLERQVTAFCFDKWLESKQGKVTIPDTLNIVLGNVTKGEHPERFPYNFIQYVEAKQNSLIEGFIAIFNGQLTEASVEHLNGFVTGTAPGDDGMRMRIIKGLVGISKELENLKKRVQKLAKVILQKEKDPAKDQNYEKDINDLKMEKSSLHSIIKSIKDKNTFNFLTDEGLLPNYAFPEAGIVLRSIIYRKKTKPDKHGKYETKIFEYERPAATAILELAPENRFYAEGRVVTIDQINMNLSEIEEWRFCTNCSFHQLLVTAVETTCCPRCGNTLWSDDGQKRSMVKMRQVIATTSDRDSRSGDDSDDREPEFFNKKMLVDVPEQEVKAAFKVDSDDFPFGIDFISKATFREVNFGKREDSASTINVAGAPVPVTGFTVCKDCGKVQKSQEIEHAMTCRHRNSTNPKDIFDFLYLYRDFSSEAIRMLLPFAASDGADKKLHSFISAIYIGLREKFEGSIDHLRTALVEEPLPDSAYRKKYLVLYDTVPGGTGYLKQMMLDEKPLLEILSISLDILRNCTCHQNPEKDGCYRCIYAYRNSFERDKTSRDAAISVLTEILSHKDHFVKTKSLKDISINPLFESELEALFIEALKGASIDGTAVQLKQEIIQGKPGWFCSVKGKGYYIEPQVELGAAQGVTVPCRADFVFYPEKRRGEKGTIQKPIVVFTDGYSFHIDRIGKDMAQRLALVKAGFRIWSVSWEDVDALLKAQQSAFDNFTLPQNYMAMMDKFDGAFGVKKLSSMASASSFEILLKFLATADESLWKSYALVHGLCRIQMQCQDAEIKTNRDSFFAAEWFDVRAQITKDGAGHCFAGLYEEINDDATPRIKMLVNIAREDYIAQRLDAMDVVCRIFDENEQREKVSFRKLWNGFIRMYNLFQFIPSAAFIASTGVADGAYSFLAEADARKTAWTSPDFSSTDELSILKKITDQSVHPLLDLLNEKSLFLPEAGYELCNDFGKIVATGELCWSHLKVALLREDELELAPHFTSQGWQIIALATVVEDPSDFLSLVEKLQKTHK